MLGEHLKRSQLRFRLMSKPIANAKGEPFQNQHEPKISRYIKE
jgi:hypothetical protein